MALCYVLKIMAAGCFFSLSASSSSAQSLIDQMVEERRLLKRGLFETRDALEETNDPDERAFLELHREGLNAILESPFEQDDALMNPLRDDDASSPVHSDDGAMSPEVVLEEATHRAPDFLPELRVLSPLLYVRNRAYQGPSADFEEDEEENEVEEFQELENQSLSSDEGSVQEPDEVFV